MEPSPPSTGTADGAGPLRWRAFAWWRTTLAVLSVLTWIVAAFPILSQAHGEFGGLAVIAWLLLAGLLSLFALLSAFIASRAFRGRRSAVYVALVQDLILLAVVVWATQSILRNRWGFDHTRIIGEVAPWLAAGTMFGAEAAYLLRTAGRWRFAWLAFALFVIAAASAVAVVPPAIAARRLEHVRSLLRYADTHWFAVPPGAKVSVGQSRAGSGHIDAITVEGKHSWWAVRATHDTAGRWVRAGSDGGPLAVPERPGEGVQVRVSTRGDAARLLALCGVPDHSLRFESAAIDPVTKGVTMYRFRSPLTQGSYEVYTYGRIRLVWKRPLDLH